MVPWAFFVDLGWSRDEFSSCDCILVAGRVHQVLRAFPPGGPRAGPAAREHLRAGAPEGTGHAEGDWAAGAHFSEQGNEDTFSVYKECKRYI